MQMAANQRKKRLNPSTVVGHNSREQYQIKKKKLDLPRYDLKMKSSISLEWDDKKKSVVSKREQIGISRRDLIPYVDAVPHHHNVLADVLAVPHDIFDFRILKEILSYEVWQTCLSEKERKLLVQFLPEGGDAYEVVQELFSGDNFHFGNPFLKWGERLCSGSFHPDDVVHHELSFKATKKAYYSECQKYHNDMIGNLQMWKERWASCKDPEKDIAQKIWRSRKPADGNMVTLAKESSRVNDTNEQHATSDSADEKDLTLMALHGESQRRKDSAEGKYDNSSDGLNVIARHRQGEKLFKRNIQRGDGAKYMSYIKVSKEQHERVMSSMKNCGNSIQARSLNHVLGNLDTFHVQPYEVFEEEERQKLHEHWLQLANKHIPAGIANWRRRQLEKQQLMKSLGQEIQEKVTSLKEDEEEEVLHNEISEQTNSGESETESSSEFSVSGQEKEGEKSDGGLLWEQLDNREAAQEMKSEDGDEDEDEERAEFIFEGETNSVTRNYEAITDDGDDASAPLSPQQQQQQQQQPISFPAEFQPLDLDPSDNNVIAEANDFPCNAPEEFSQKMNHMDAVTTISHSHHHHHHHHNMSSTSDLWPSVSMPFYPSEMSVGNSHVVIDHQPAPLIDLEADMAEEEEDNTKNLVHNNGNSSFFNPNEDQRRDLLQSLFKGHNAAALPYHEAAGNVMMPHFPPPLGFREPSIHPSSISLGQKRLMSGDTYMHHHNNIIHDINNNNNNIYSDAAARYSIPRQEQFMPLSIQDWSPHISAPPTSHLSAPVNNHHRNNWFYSDNRGRGVWTGGSDIVVPNPAIVGNGNNNNSSNIDQNLFSVISQCNELGSSATYDPMGPIQYGGAPATNVVLPPRMADPLKFLGGTHEAAAGSLKSNNINNIGWMNLPHQTTALQDSLGKPFLRPWNH